MPYTPRRYTMLHLGAMGMESLAPEFFNVTLEKAFYTPHTTALSATRPRTLESAPSASVSPRCRAVHARAGVVPRDVYYCTTREQMNSGRPVRAIFLCTCC